MNEKLSPEFEDGPASSGFRQCTPFNGGHSWTSPYRERLEWVVRCNKCGSVHFAPQVDQPSAKAKEFMVAARNAQMFQDIRSVIATCADLKARAPYRHIEARRLLPMLDAFLGEGYTGRVIELKRMIETRDADSNLLEYAKKTGMTVEETVSLVTVDNEKSDGSGEVQS